MAVTVIRSLNVRAMRTDVRLLTALWEMGALNGIEHDGSPQAA